MALAKVPGQLEPNGDVVLRQEIADDARRIWWWSLSCARSHFATANLWRVLHTILTGSTAVLAAVTGVSALANLIGPTGAGVGSLSAAAVGALAATLGAEQRAQAATGTANLYVELRDHARQFLRIDLATMELAAARETLREITSQYHKVNRGAEVPLRVARWRARRLLARDQRRGDETIDLPPSSVLAGHGVVER